MHIPGDSFHGYSVSAVEIALAKLCVEGPVEGMVLGPGLQRHGKITSGNAIDTVVRAKAEADIICITGNGAPALIPAPLDA